MYFRSNEHISSRKETGSSARAYISHLFASCTALRATTAALAATLTLLAPAGARAQNTANADAAYNGFLSAFLVNPDAAGYTFIDNGLTDKSHAFFWVDSYMITALEDAYDNHPSSERQQLISKLLTSGWTLWTTNTDNGDNLGSDTSGDSWNDDSAWGTIALVRGYIDTNNTTFLKQAETVWNMAYNRGWDSTYGGGIWENEYNVPAGGKCGLSNWPFVISGVMLYQATGDSSYLTKSEQIYAWGRANIFDTTTGRVWEGVYPASSSSSTGVVSGDDNVYNSGLIVNAANSLYQVTNNSQYYNDAKLAAQHVINNYPIMTVDKPRNGDFGGEQFFRGLSNFARQNNLWTTYSPWLQNNANAAWNERRTDLNITHNDFATATPAAATGNQDADNSMEFASSVTIQAVTAINPIGGDHVIASSYNGITIDDANSTNQGTSVVLWNWDGGPQQKWNFSQNGDGSWTIKSKQSGLVLDDPASSKAVGGSLCVWPANGGDNQKWLVNQQSNGLYEIQNKVSGFVLDSSSTSSNGVGLVQWPVNNQSQQLWFLR